MIKKYDYLSVEQFVYTNQATEEQLHAFVDAFVKLVEDYNFTTGGSFSMLTEDEAQSRWEEEDRKEEQYKRMMKKLGLKK